MSTIEANTIAGNDKKAFEIFLKALIEKNVTDEDEFEKVYDIYNEKFQQKMAGRQLKELLLNAVEHLAKQGQGHKWMLGGPDEQLVDFNKEGFERLLKLNPPLLEVWKQRHTKDSEMFLPENSALAAVGTEVERYYENNSDRLEEEWEEHLYSNDWGSGEDKINITNEMFWEFIEEQFHKENEQVSAILAVIDGSESDEELEALAELVLSENKWARKPQDIREVENYTTTRQSVDGMPEVSDYELYDRDVDEVFPLGVSFSYAPPAQMFVMKTEEYGDFLIDTQGYDYAKYMKKIVDKPKVSADSGWEQKAKELIDLDEKFRKSIFNEAIWEHAEVEDRSEAISYAYIEYLEKENLLDGYSEEDKEKLKDAIYNEVLGRLP